VPTGEITACGSCGHEYLSPVIDLGYQPLAERDNGECYPLKLLKCARCTLVQLSFIPAQEEVFPGDHPYATGNTKALRDHFTELAATLGCLLFPEDLVVDIGANDGTLITQFPPEVRRIAVEPTDQAAKCRARDITTWQEFFTCEIAKDIRAYAGPAKVITACNVLAHVPDPHDFIEGVKILLADDGVFVTENHDWASIANGLQIDTIYHEHLRYYSVASLSFLLAKHGFLVSGVIPVNTHGGSSRTFAVKEDPQQLARRARTAMEQLGRLLETASAEGKIYGIGACTRTTPLIHYADIVRYIECVCEVPGSDKIGMNIPGTFIPVVDEKKLIEDQPPYALLFAWHWAQSIVPGLRKKGYKGKFIIPLPWAVIYE
jgi:2-polyprenyl-3-methyl-5-hydroxy-6-metoxy-1,4-benzoquinol methylase